MRYLTATLAFLLALAVGVPVADAAGAPRTAAKVVVIVGPVAEITDRYRARGADAAAAARRYSSNVVEISSPNATWPAVRAALQDASVVVYLGHGNGWPSRYREALYPPTQNGFGLNPVAGVDDDTHQYFGEAWIAKDVRLAPNAVVILSHLCYASGNTEPGLEEGTVDEARQRVDNYAAGFIAAGARAVIADARVSAAWYVRQLLGGRDPVDRIWNGAGAGGRTVVEFESVRSPGFVARMRPDRADGGFYRSIVHQPGLTAGQVWERVTTQPPGTAGATPGAPLPAPEPSLAHAGLEFGPPAIEGPALAGATTNLAIPAASRGEGAPEVALGVRWDPLDVDAAGADGGAPGGGGGKDVAPDDEWPDPDLAIQPERVGRVVTPVPASWHPDRIEAAVTLPSRPGLYRLVTTLHQADGLAYDAATQALLPAMLVRVTGEAAVRYGVATTVSVDAGTPFTLEVEVENRGVAPWGAPAVERPARSGLVHEAAARARLVARWVPLESQLTDAGVVDTALPGGLAPFRPHDAVLSLRAPVHPGLYLVLLDTVVPGLGSLAAHGLEPAIVRVSVVDGPRSGE